MDTTLPAAQLFDYDVTNSDGNKLGSVDGIWVDAATNAPEFVAVKTGWLFGQDHIMPLEQAQIDNDDQTIQVPYSGDQIKNGPSFDTNAELSAADEQQIYSYYGMQRSTQVSPTGYSTGTAPIDTETDNVAAPETETTTAPNNQGEQTLTLSEEELQVGKREQQIGQVHVRKIVRTEHQEIPVELRREEVEIERVPASETGISQVPDNAFQERAIDVPVMEEKPVVAKEARVTSQVVVGKTAQTETQTIEGDVRKEDIQVDQEDDGDIEGTPSTS